MVILKNICLIVLFILQVLIIDHFLGRYEIFQNNEFLDFIAFMVIVVIMDYAFLKLWEVIKRTKASI